MTLLIQYTLIFASVLMLVALGGCFAERSGVINIGLEGIMVIGALGGALVLKFMPVSVGAPVMVITTVIVSALFGMIFSLLLAVAAINFKADQTITGTAMNMLATAAATVAVKAMNTAASGGNDVSSDISYTRTKDLLLVHVGGFELNWFMLVAVLCLIAAYVALYKPRFGLRPCGCRRLHPNPADGIAVDHIGQRIFGHGFGQVIRQPLHAVYAAFAQIRPAPAHARLLRAHHGQIPLRLRDAQPAERLVQRHAHANAARIRHLRRTYVDFLNLRRRRRAACRRLHRAKFIFLQIFARPRGVERLRRVVDRRKLEKRLCELRHPAFRLLRVVFLRQRRAG